MAGGEDDLFGGSSSDGGDTDDLIASARGGKKDDKAAAPIAKKKSEGGAPKRLQKKSDKKRKFPDADNDDSDDDDNKSDIEEKDEAAALFDSDDDSDDDGGGGGTRKKAKKLKQKKKPKKEKKKEKGKKDDGAPKKKLSKKERMEALARKRQELVSGPSDDGPIEGGLELPAEDEEARRRRKAERKEKGYDSEDSYDSRTFVRTKEDDDFIDAEGEDPDAIKELYAEQHFDDERPDDESSEEEDGGRSRKGKKGKAKYRRRGPDALSDDELKGDEEPENPIMAAVYRMKKKKKEAKKISELEDMAKEFITRMEKAADEDEQAIKEKRPATKKLAMLPEVLDMLAKREMMRPLLNLDLLIVCKRWIQPLPSGALGNVTVRQRLLDAIGNMTGEQGVSPNDLKRSAFGKVVMSLYMHKSETPQMKRQLKTLIEQWSRPIFQKSGDMKDLERVQASRRDVGIVGIARAQQAASASVAVASQGRDEHDLTSVIAKGYENKGASRDLGNNRVRVPFSKGFQFTVRPAGKLVDAADKRSKTRQGAAKEGRDALHKRMLEKNRPVSKNQRSANISIEGRPTK